MMNENKYSLFLTILIVMISGCGGQASSITSYTGNAILSWSTPTEYSDGSAMLASNITGYEIYTGSSSRHYDCNHLVSASTASFRISDLNVPKGSFYAAITTLDKSGCESTFSSEVSATLN